MKLLSKRERVYELIEQRTFYTPKLAELDRETVSVEEVYKLLDWGDPKPEACDECNKGSWRCVQLGQDPDWESSTAIICEECLGKAFDLAWGD